MKTPMQILCDRIQNLIDHLRQPPRRDTIVAQKRIANDKDWQALIREGIEILRGLGAEIEDGEINGYEIAQRLEKIKAIIEESEVKRKEMQVIFADLTVRLYWGVQERGASPYEVEQKIVSLLQTGDMNRLFAMAGVKVPERRGYVDDQLKIVWPTYEGLVAHQLQKAASGEEVAPGADVE